MQVYLIICIAATCVYIRPKVKLSECIDDMQYYTDLTDHVFHQILLSTDPKLKKVNLVTAVAI